MPTTNVRRATAAATFALFASMTTGAFAAGMEFRWKDLDLSTAAGKAEFDRRVDVVASQMCGNGAITGSRINTSRESCKAGVREEITQKVAARTDRGPSLAAATGKTAH